MIVILGMDGLEYDFVKEHGFKNLMQTSYGKTDLSDFKEPRTIIIWSSFMTGNNLEETILESEVMWNFSIKKEDTFLAAFDSSIAVDVPGYSYIKEQHNRERAALKGFFDEKTVSVEEYDEIAFTHHRRMKTELWKLLDEGHDLVMVYFNIADVIGHISFGIKSKMKIIYSDLDALAKEVSEKYKCPIMIVADHGMQAIGRFGDHSDHGFWSLNFEHDLGTPKPTDLADFIATVMKQKTSI